MGYAYGQTCYATQSEAALAFCAGEYPIPYTYTVQSGSVPVTYPSVLSCLSTSGTVVNLENVQNSSRKANYSISVNFPTCDWETFVSSPAFLSMADGVVMSGAIVGLWIVAWSVRVVRSVLKDHSEND